MKILLLLLTFYLSNPIPTPKALQIEATCVEEGIVPKEKKLRTEIIKTARNYLGSDYQYGGTTPSGFDCSGFISFVLNEYGYESGRSSSQIASKGLPVSQYRVKAGDLLFFGSGTSISHVALATKVNKHGDITIIHSTTSGGVMEEIFNESIYWKSKFMFARDIITKASR